MNFSPPECPGIGRMHSFDGLFLLACIQDKGEQAFLIQLLFDF